MPEFFRGMRVEYQSEEGGEWIPARFLDVHSDGTYELDICDRAPSERVRPFRAGRTSGMMHVTDHTTLDRLRLAQPARDDVGLFSVSLRSRRANVRIVRKDHGGRSHDSEEECDLNQLAGDFFGLQSRGMSRPLATRPAGGYVLEIILRGKCYKLPEISERTLAELGVCDGVTITLRFPHVKSLSSAGPLQRKKSQCKPQGKKRGGWLANLCLARPRTESQ